MLAICVRLCSCLCIACSKCFRSSHAYHLCSVVFLPWYSLFKMFQKISCLAYVFHSVLACGKPAHACVSEALLPALWTNISLRFQAPQQQYTMLSFSSMRRHGHSHKLTSFTCTMGITLWAYLSQTHRPNLRY